MRALPAGFMRPVLSRLFGARARRPAKARNTAPRLHSPVFPGALYAVGDVHGRLDLLTALEARIVEHARDVTGEVWIILLGDVVDRGPSSAQVIDHLLAEPAPGFRRICLGGNHEEAMLDALGDPQAYSLWRGVGGSETLASYGINAARLEGRSWETVRAALDRYIPQTHRTFLETLPVLLQVPGFVLVHAGLRPGIPLAEQTDRDLRWLGSDAGGAEEDFTIVHGHTIVPRVMIGKGRIAVDTGAYKTGRLSAVCLAGPGAAPVVIEQRG